MKDIFNLPHIFIVFNYGSSGNFLSGLCNSITKQRYSPLEIHKDGSSHTLVEDKIKGKDYLSFGTFLLEHKFFSSEHERENFYVTKINQYFNQDTEPKVVWSHDFTNIPLYRKYFPNSKILVITTYSSKEFFSSLIMNVNKIFLNQSAILPTTEKIWNLILKKMNDMCRKELYNLLGNDADRVLLNRFDESNKPLIEYAALSHYIRYYRLLDDQQSLFNCITYPDNNLNPIIGKELSTYIDKDCITLPYSYLIENNLNLLLEKISQLFNKDLTSEETKFIEIEFSTYRKIQNRLVLEDPFSYYKNLKNIINSIKYSIIMD